MKKIVPEFSYIVDVRQIPANGLSVDLTADKNQCKALADRFGLPDVRDFIVHAQLIKINKDRIRLNAEIQATVEQVCVVSLEKFEQKVQDSFSVVFSQETDPSLKLNEIDLNPQEDEDMEFLENGKIDLGEISSEYLSLALDPFPHAPNAVFQSKSDTENKKNAFSVLEKLQFK